MILDTKPKRVRFRIKSGEEEHNSLDSLKLNFVWNDIKQLFDGRLQKWLKRIDENSIAEEIESLGKPKDIPLDLLRVYNALFRRNSTEPFHTIEDVIAEVLRSERDSKTAAINLMHQILPMLTVESLIDLVDKYDNMKGALYPYIETYIKTINEEEAPETLYRLGKLLCNENFEDETGQKLIILASDKNLQEANDFIEQNFPWLGKGRTKWLSNLYKDPQVSMRLYESWGGKSIDVRKTSYLKDVLANKETKTLFDFSDTCLKIYRRGKSSTPWKEYYDIPEKNFGNFDEKDPLYEEKMFVLALFDSDNDERRKQRLKKISYYPPAKEMDDRNKYETQNFNFEHPYMAHKNALALKEFILNLPKLRGEEVGVLECIIKNKGKENLVNRVSILEINKVLIDEKFIERSKLFWVSKTEMPKSDLSDAENEVVDFINGCIRIAKSKDPYETAVEIFDPLGKNKMQCSSIGNCGQEGQLSESDPLFPEKKFILALFDRNFDRARRNLNEIKDTFGAARAILNSPDKKVTIERHSYQLQLYVSSVNNQRGLQFFSTNILKFRNYGK